MPNKLITVEEAAKRFVDKINSIPDKCIRKAVLEWLSMSFLVGPSYTVEAHKEIIEAFASAELRRLSKPMFMGFSTNKPS